MVTPVKTTRVGVVEEFKNTFMSQSMATLILTHLEPVIIGANSCMNYQGTVGKLVLTSPLVLFIAILCFPLSYSSLGFCAARHNNLPNPNNGEECRYLTLLME